MRNNEGTVDNDDDDDSGNSDSNGTDIEAVANVVDIERVYEKISEHDEKFDKESESGQIYKENVYYYRLAKNLEEEKEFGAINVESYLIMNSRYLYCIDLDTYNWALQPLPV